MSYLREPTWGFSIPCCFSLHDPPLAAWPVELETSKSMSGSGCWDLSKSDLHQTWTGVITDQEGLIPGHRCQKSASSLGDWQLLGWKMLASGPAGKVSD